jgi:hypothetical protein
MHSSNLFLFYAIFWSKKKDDQEMFEQVNNVTSPSQKIEHSNESQV